MVDAVVDAAEVLIASRSPNTSIAITLALACDMMNAGSIGSEPEPESLSMSAERCSNSAFIATSILRFPKPKLCNVCSAKRRCSRHRAPSHSTSPAHSRHRQFGYQ